MSRVSKASKGSKREVIETKTVKVQKLTDYEQGRLDERNAVLNFIGKMTNPHYLWKWRAYNLGIFLYEEIRIGRFGQPKNVNKK